MPLAPPIIEGDWDSIRRAVNYFNSKLDATADVTHASISLTGLTAGHICYVDSDLSITGSASLTWDNTNKLLTVTGYCNITDEANGYQIDGIRTLSRYGTGNIFLDVAGNFTMSGTQNFFLGLNSGIANTTGLNNVGVGVNTLRDNTIGAANIAIGEAALLLNVDGINNTAIGSVALRSNVSGVENVAIGQYAGYSSVGSYNTFIGRSAGHLATGSNNTIIGRSAGYSCTGSSNVLLGYLAGLQQTTNSNLLIIDNQDRASADNERTNSLIYGVFNATPASQTLRLNAAVTIPYTLQAEYLGLGSGTPAAATPFIIDYDINAATLYGEQLSVTSTRNATSGSVRGLYFTAEWKPASTLAASARMTGGIYGVFGTPKIDSTNVDNAYDLYTDELVGGFFQLLATKGGSHSGACYATEGAGIWIANPVLVGGATITTNYGLYIASQTAGTANYSIYSAGGQSVHAGNLTLGSVTPGSGILNAVGITNLGDGGTTNYIGISATGDISFNGSAGFYPVRLSTAVGDEPSPDTGELIIWHDETNNKVYLKYNDTDEGDVKVEMT